MLTVKYISFFTTSINNNSQALSLKPSQHMAHYTLIPNWLQSPQSVAKGHANAILPRRFVLQRNGVQRWRGVGAGEWQLLPARSQG